MSKLITYGKEKIVLDVIENVFDLKKEEHADGTFTLRWSTGMLPQTTHEYILVNDDDPIEFTVGQPIPEQAILDQIKQKRIEELNETCKKTILAGFRSVHTDRYYGYTLEDQINMNQQMLLLVSDPAISSVEWKTKDAGIIEHTREQFLAVCREAEGHKRKNMNKFWDLKQQILSAESVEEVDAVDW